jgi:hypothetical protein
MRQSVARRPTPPATPTVLEPVTYRLRDLDGAELVLALTSLLPAGRHAATALDGREVWLDVFVTFERRAGRRTPCAIRVIVNRCEFAFDDGCDEFARTRLAGAPCFDLHGNIQISAVRRTVEGRRRGSSLWVAHDLSSLAIDDEMVRLRLR